MWRVNVLFRHEDTDEVLPKLDEVALTQEGTSGVAGTGHQSWEFPTGSAAQAFARQAQDSCSKVTVIQPEEVE